MKQPKPSTKSPTGQTNTGNLKTQDHSGRHDYTDIAIIYNPKSTGNSKANAEKLAKQLQSTALSKLVRVIATDGVGHAETLAYEIATASARPLIVSSSGDGGYNEVINGVLRAQQASGHHKHAPQPTCGLLPSGNANDHYRNLHRKPIAEQIVSGDHQKIDMLSISANRDGRPWSRHAHSYIGVGLTPKVGRELNKVRLNRLVEAWIVVRTLYRLRGSRLVVRGREQTYDSLIFSNIGSMSKILTISDSAKLADGKFEIIAFPTRSRWYLLSQLLRASTVGLHTSRQADRYTFSTVGRTYVQLDGEIFRLDAHSQVHISLLPKALRCII